MTTVYSDVSRDQRVTRAHINKEVSNPDVNKSMMSHVEALSKELRSLIDEYPSLRYVSAKNRIQCNLSGHEMACTVEAVKTYVTGKKFAKLRARDDNNYDQYQPHLVPSTSGPKKLQQSQLFCTLTLRHINKTPEHVLQHVNGARYKRALKKWEECQKNGTEFKPPGWNRMKRQKTKGDDSMMTDEDDKGEISDADSLSDLYPGKFLKASDDEDEEKEAVMEDNLDDEEENASSSDYDPDAPEVIEDNPVVNGQAAPAGPSSMKHKAKKDYSDTRKKQQKKKKQKVG